MYTVWHPRTLAFLKIAGLRPGNVCFPSQCCSISHCVSDKIANNLASQCYSYLSIHPHALSPSVHKSVCLSEGQATEPWMLRWAVTAQGESRPALIGSSQLFVPLDRTKSAGTSAIAGDTGGTPTDVPYQNITHTAAWTVTGENRMSSIDTSKTLTQYLHIALTAVAIVHIGNNGVYFVISLGVLFQVRE